MERRIFAIGIIMMGLAFTGLAQSGRKIIAKPTPQVIKADDPAEYSESKPKNRHIRKQQPVVQAPPPRQDTSTTDNEETLKIETNLITIPVSVFDRNGRYIPWLRRSDFRIFENDIEQEIAYFETQDEPITVALLLDTSASTEYKIDEIKQAAKAFVEQLEAHDSVIVIEFNGSVKVRVRATTNRKEISQAIDKVDVGGGTDLYNAVDEGLRNQLGRVKGRKALVLFTDGVDTTSTKNTYDSTLNYAEESDALIFPIYYNTYFENRQRSGDILSDILLEDPLQDSLASEYALGRRYLQELADATGGACLSTRVDARRPNACIRGHCRRASPPIQHRIHTKRRRQARPAKTDQGASQPAKSHHPRSR